jgi:hypothetical protein
MSLSRSAVDEEDEEHEEEDEEVSTALCSGVSVQPNS